ncbi:hypothetical protein [Amycolatopsis thermoflava]|uniref:hypothetical protein n=1 Tax=Amycolatopsis thermoflava TaxID=84480 RepID=UPI0004243538|nr:hypothetical protein [Amycolatopsis thermoflava]
MTTSSKRWVRAGLVATAAIAGVVAAAPAAGAAGADYMEICQSAKVSCQNGAKVSGPGSYDRCGTTTAAASYTQVCVEYDGDVVYVKDGSADGSSSFGKVSSTSGTAYRFCRNPHGAGTWAKCDFDWSEAADKQVYGGVKLSYTNFNDQYLFSFTNG